MTEHNYGNYLTIDLWCEHCGTRSIATLLRTKATYENRWDCADCGAAASLKRVPSAPMVAKASYPDGYKRAGFQELKEANHLRIEAVGLKPSDQSKVTTEINRLEKRTPKE